MLSSNGGCGSDGSGRGLEDKLGSGKAHQVKSSSVKPSEIETQPIGINDEDAYCATVAGAKQTTAKKGAGSDDTTPIILDSRIDKSTNPYSVSSNSKAGIEAKFQDEEFASEVRYLHTDKLLSEYYSKLGFKGSRIQSHMENDFVNSHGDIFTILQNPIKGLDNSQCGLSDYHMFKIILGNRRNEVDFFNSLDKEHYEALDSSGLFILPFDTGRRNFGEDTFSYAVMAFHNGIPANRLVKEKNPYIAASVAYFLAEALDKLHSCNILHMDIKPGNVLISENEMKLIDFGNSYYLDEPLCKYTGACLSCTPSYVSPLYFMSHLYGKKEDIYGLFKSYMNLLTGTTAMDVRYGSDGSNPDNSTFSLSDIPFDDVDPSLRDLVKRGFSVPLAKRDMPRDLTARLYEYTQNQGNMPSLQEIKKAFKAYLTNAYEIAAIKIETSGPALVSSDDAKRYSLLFEALPYCAPVPDIHNQRQRYASLFSKYHNQAQSHLDPQDVADAAKEQVQQR